MTNEEMQKTMEFIVGQQAQFAANIQKLEEQQERFEANQEKSQERMSQIENVVLRLANAVQQQVEAQTHINKQLAEAQTTTIKQLAETDERLNALINVVERFIGEGRNGTS